MRSVLHSASSDSDSSTVYSDALKTSQEPTGQSFDNVQERVAFQLATPLPAGSKGEIKIAFTGELTSSMQGYYKSAWEHEGKTKHYALTQFEVSKPSLFKRRRVLILLLGYCRASLLPLLGRASLESYFRHHHGFPRIDHQLEQHARRLGGDPWT